MPELPEVETICKQLAPHLEGRKITGLRALVKRLRKPLNEKSMREKLVGSVIKKVYRRAKFIVIETAKKQALLIHLGMTGSLSICKKDAILDIHDRFCLGLTRKEELRLHDIRRFGCVEVCALDIAGELPQVLAHLGPEPLESDFTANYFFAKCRKSKAGIKNFIMNQKVVVGVGNIYACEALFRACISPARLSCSLRKKECVFLRKMIRQVLREAIKWGGTTIRDYQNVDGEAGKFVQKLAVYGRKDEKCLQCGKKIKRIVLGGRASFYCPNCQK